MFDSESDEYIAIQEPQERSTKRCRSKYSLGHFVSGAGGRVLDAASAELMPLFSFCSASALHPEFYSASAVANWIQVQLPSCVVFWLVTALFLPLLCVSLIEQDVLADHIEETQEPIKYNP